MLVHLPIALAVLMPILSFGVLVAWWRGALPRRTWAIVVTFQLLLVGGGLVAMRTGSAEEERVEDVVGEAAIHAHEEAAEVFVWGSVGVLALSALALLLRDERRSRLAAAAAALGTVAVLGLGYRVGEAGGALVYRHGAASAYADPSGGTAAPDDDDDD